MAVITTGNVPKALWGDAEGMKAAARRRLPSSDFALPGKGTGKEGKGSGSYLIEHASHARNALARAAGNASSEEQATIKRKVKAKFPGIKVAQHNDGGPAYHCGRPEAHRL